MQAKSLCLLPVAGFVKGQSRLNGYSRLALVFAAAAILLPSVNATILPGPAAAPAFVQGTASHNHSDTSSLSASFTSNTTPGNLIIVTASTDNGTTPIATPTDTQGNTYALANAVDFNGAKVRTWYAKNIQGGPATVTVTGSWITYMEMAVSEYSGLDPVNPYDVSSAGSSLTGTTLDSGLTTAATSQASELLYGFGWVNGVRTLTPGANFTMRLNSQNPDSGIATEDQNVFTTGAYNATFAASAPSVDWAAQVIAFKAAAAGSIGAPPASPAAWSISGSIVNGAGAAVSLTGAAAATAVADPSGNYTLTNVANGSYTVAVNKPSFTFVPASQNATVNGASPTGVNFTGSPSATAAAPAFVQGKTNHNHSDTSSLSASFTSNTTPGNLIIVTASTDNGTTPIATPSDTQGNTYALANAVDFNGAKIRTWYAKNIQGGPATVTVAGSWITYMEMAVSEYSGLNPVNPYDVSSGGSSFTGNALNSGLTAAATSQATELLYGFGWVNGVRTLTAGSNFTMRLKSQNPDSGIATEDRNVSTASAYNATFAASAPSVDWATQVIAFKAAAGGSAVSGGGTLPGGTPAGVPPSVPTALSAAAASPSQINLSWSASTAQVSGTTTSSVAGYKIYRGGVQIGTTAASTYSDTGLSPSTLYTYTVASYDKAGDTSAKSSPVSVTTPAATVSVGVSINPAASNLQAGQTQQFTATVTGASNRQAAWSLTPQLGGISAGGLYTAPSAVASQQTVMVVATSMADKTKSASARVTLMATSGVTITTISLPSGALGSLYNAILVATGGTAPYTWSISSGQLPPGLALTAATGIILGTPTAAGAYNVTVHTTDAAGRQASKSLSVAVAAALIITTANLPDGGVGAPYNDTIATLGGTPPLSWTLASGHLPPGVSLDPASGELSGTPSSGGAYNFAVKVADSSSPQQSASKPLAINITASATDIYGGLLSLPSQNPSTGNWRTEKIGSQWWFIDPLNNAFHFVAPYNVGMTDPAVVYSKYSVSDQANNWPCGYLPSVAQRLKAWNFTGLGGGSVRQMWPFGQYICWPYDSTLGGNYPTPPNRMPIVLYYQTSLNGMMNRVQDDRATPNAAQPTKMIEYGLNGNFGWAPYISAQGTADYGDSRLYNYFDFLLVHRQDNQTYFTSPPALQKYVVGILIDEADEMGAFSTGGDSCGTTSSVQTSGGPNALCSGKEHTNGGLVAFATSPLQNANRMKGAIYPDPEVYVKASIARNYLKSTYGTVAALNSAWGTTYSNCDMEGAGDQFGSCGTQVRGEAFAAGTGAATYTHTLARLKPSMHSIGLYVGGVLVAGDLGCNFFESDINCTPGNPLASNTSKFFGGLVNSSTSTIDYTTGAASVTFQPGSSAIMSVSGNGSTVTVKVGKQDLSYSASGHGAWPGAHVTISGTSSYNLSGTVASVIDPYTFTIANSRTGAPEINGTASFTDAGPGPGIPITISYVQNGWGIGNGVMDEDGRHAPWMGNANDGANGVNLYLAPNDTVRKDINNILGAEATAYFSGMDAVFSRHFGPKGPSRTVLNLGPDPLIYWASPSHAGVLQAAGKYLDVIGIQSYMFGQKMTQARLDWIRANAGDIPLMNVDFITANPDSSERTHAGNQDFDHYSTQAARGAAYQNYVQSLTSLAYTSSGDKPYVGSEFWTWFDSDGEQTNFGLVTTRDNSYDGKEDVTGTVTCSAPLQAFKCGGEPYNSGDFIDWVKSGNALWLTPR